MRFLSCHAVRVTRDADSALALGRTEDLLTSIEESVRDRRMGTAVRLQYDSDLPQAVLNMFIDELDLRPEDLYAGEGFTAFTDLFQLYGAVDLPQQKDQPWTPLPVPACEKKPDMWSAIREGDILVHHPYQSFRCGDALCGRGRDRPECSGH